MKFIISILLILIFFTNLFGQTNDVSWDNYLKRDLSKLHHQTAYAFEDFIRNGKVNEIKKNLPQDSSWQTENKLFLIKLDSSQYYFPICVPIDTTYMLDRDPFSKLNLTRIRFVYLCKQDGVEPFEYNIEFVFSWNENETKNFEINFSKHPDRNEIKKILEEIPLPKK